MNEYPDVWETEEGLKKYFEFYNYRKPRQSSGYKTPFEIYRTGLQPEENKKAKAADS